MNNFHPQDPKDPQDEAIRQKIDHYFALDKPALETFIVYVDESNFSLEDWLESLDFLRSWLLSQRLELGLIDSIEYLHCASKIAPNGQSLSALASLTEEFLKLYGCERATKIE